MRHQIMIYFDLVLRDALNISIDSLIKSIDTQFSCFFAGFALVSILIYMEIIVVLKQ